MIFISNVLPLKLGMKLSKISCSHQHHYHQDMLTEEILLILRHHPSLSAFLVLVVIELTKNARDFLNLCLKENYLKK